MSARDDVVHTPWWWEDAPPRDTAPGEVSGDCDVAVVGAGYTGLTAALYLARAGRAVQVFDKEQPGAGASTRNGGITSGSLRVPLEQAVRTYGAERGLGMYREATEARRFLKSLIDETGIACHYRLSGIFVGSLTQRDLDAQRQMAGTLQARLGAAQRIVESPELPSVTGSPRYLGGLLNEEVGTIHPAKLHAGLLDAAETAGARVLGQTAVRGITRTKSGFEIDTERGRTRAGAVIMATNGYTDAVNPWLRRRLIPVKSRIVVTEPLPENLINALVPDGRAMGEVRQLYHYYRQTPDGKRLLLGGREPAWGGGVDAAIAHLRQGFVTIFPELAPYRITHSWAGNVAFNRAYLPTMFRHDGIHYAVGYCGSGTVWAPWLGYKTAMRILQDARAGSHFETRPPKPVPLYAGKPWFLPLMISGYGWQDRLKGRG